MRAFRLVPAALGAAWLVWASVNTGLQAAPPGGNWPQFRGPMRDGISPETGLIQSWPAGGPPKIWSKAGMGAGFSSVSIGAGRLFTMGDFSDGQHVLAFDEETGNPLWSTRIGGRHDDEYGGPRATPTIDGAMIYTMDTDGDLVALDAATGKERWRKNLPREYGSRTPTWMFAESPLVDGERVIITPGTSKAAMVALSKQTGVEIWRAQMPGLGNAGFDSPEYSSVVVSNGGGVKQYIRLLGRGVISVRASDGAFMWGYNKIANGTANIPTPIVSGNLIFTSSGYSTGAALLEIAPAAAGTVTAAEKYFLGPGTFFNHHGGMVLVGNYIYSGKGQSQGIPICIELATGKVMWGGNIRNAGNGSAAVLAADGRLYFHYENGVMMLIEASPTAYKEVGTFTLPNYNSNHPSWSHPVIAAGRLYVREQNDLHVYDVKKH